MAKIKKPIGCCGSVRIGKSIVRNASKTIEKQMIQQANKLYDDPFIILPTCLDETCKKRFKKLKKEIEKIDKIKDDIKKLEKASNKKNLQSALAGTLLIHHSKKAPFLAAAQVPSGTVLFAQRGNALRDHLIGIQHHDDPFYRLLAIRDIVLKNDLYVYSWETSYLCSSYANPPEDFIKFIIKKLNLKLTKKIAHCSHINSKHIEENKGFPHPYLNILWQSADIKICICKQCASKTSNLIFEITKYMIEPDLQKDFLIQVIGGIIHDSKLTSEQDTEFVEDYFSGRLSDFQIIEKNMNLRLKHLKDSKEIRYIINKTQYESAKEFINALHPSNYEKKALTYLLDKHNKSLVVNDVTPNSVIEMLWDDYGLDLLIHIISDETTASDLFALQDIPSQIIKTAYDLQKRKEILTQLPRYKQLPPLANFVDHLARIYRVEGKKQVLIEIKNAPKETKGKALTYGFLLALQNAKDFKWKYEKEEIESGEFLKQYIEKLLTCSSESYHNALQDVLTFSGTSIDISTYKI